MNIPKRLSILLMPVVLLLCTMVSFSLSDSEVYASEKLWDRTYGTEFHTLLDNGVTVDAVRYGTNECVIYGAQIGQSTTFEVPAQVKAYDGVTYKVVGIISLAEKEGVYNDDTLYEAHGYYENGMLKPFSTNRQDIATIVLPSSIKFIGKFAFAGFGSLEEVRFASQVDMEDYAFLDCRNLLTFNYPSGSKIHSHTLWGCCNLKKVTDAPEYFIIGDSSEFHLEELSFAAGVKKIEGVFNVPSLRKVTLPEGVETIDDESFKDCRNLSSINLPNSIEYIGEEAFMGCKNLKISVVHKGRRLENTYKNSGITGFTWNPPNDKTGYFPISINLASFNGCKNLQFINMTHTTYSGSRFYSEDGVLYYVTEDKKKELVRYPPGKNRNGTFKVPDNVKTLYEFAFTDCSLNTIYLPKNIDYLHFYHDEYQGESGEGPFSAMDVAANIHYNPDSCSPEGYGIVNGKRVSHNWVQYPVPKISKITNRGGVNYSVTKQAGNGTGEVKVTGSAEKTITKLTIPNQFKYNGKNYKVISIEKKAFSGRKKLKTVVVGSNVKTIGDQAFSNCPKLTKVTIGKSVKTIGKSCFQKDKKLKTIIVKSNKLKKVGKNALKGINKKAKIKVPKKHLKKYKKLFMNKGQSKTVKITK